MRGREYEVVPPGEKTVVVFPSEVEEEDERGRSRRRPIGSGEESERRGEGKRGGADS